MEKNQLKDYKINIKLKLSLLWTSVTLFYLYGDYFELYVPKKVEGLISGDNLLNNPLNLFIAAILLGIPAIMVLISILAKPIINKWLNIITGLFFTVIMLLIAYMSISEWRFFYVCYAIIESILTAIIAWNAINWPKQSSNI